MCLKWTYPKKHTFKRQWGGGLRNSSVVIRVEWKWHQVKLCFKQCSLHPKRIFKQFQYTGKQHFHLWQWSFDIVLFSENNVCTWSSRIRFSFFILCLWVLERFPNELFKDCHRQTPKPVVWTHSLAITPQRKGAIFFHGKGWMVSTGFKHHTIKWKQRFQHIKALFIHFMQFCGPWITHKNDIPVHLGQPLKWQKILVSNIFYLFCRFTWQLGVKDVRKIKARS